MRPLLDRVELPGGPSDVRGLLRVPPGRVRLADYPTDSHPGSHGKTAALTDRHALEPVLAGLQERCYAQGHRTPDRRRLVLVLQGMDCSGKDGAIKHVVGAFNPEGVKITSFKRPTAEELRHHFLWRVERALPGPGDIGVLNRSHYEDVTVVRVHDLVPPEQWQRRYDEINEWERRESDDGVIWLKVFLHISAEEQRRRLLQRLDDPSKHWKFEAADLDERGYWDDYQRAYETVLERCSPPQSPWYVLPADRKWYRNWALARLLAETLAAMDPRYPEPDLDLSALRARLSA
ncbi:MAG TPA: PPK2 family polyphosphate kinase [Frankiaceae bacterium]|jgi:PPK2 family polyphosphate:nucleotide phosphotransferase|nr:UDP-galactose-lipid carrier transferase [Mycobacterium sp.]